jgi:hypothetical protein
MFSLPPDSLSLNDSEPIFIDEKAEVLAFIISELQLSDHQDIRDQTCCTEDVSVLHATVVACDKFDIDGPKGKAEARLQQALRKNPFKAFVTASRERNLDLGRRAIKFMRLRQDLNFWDAIGSARYSWQLALTRLLIPQPTPWIDVYDYDPGHEGAGNSSRRVNMDGVAETFEPKSVMNRGKTY